MLGRFPGVALVWQWSGFTLATFPSYTATEEGNINIDMQHLVTNRLTTNHNPHAQLGFWDTRMLNSTGALYKGISIIPV